MTVFEKMSHLDAGWLEALKADLLSDYMEDLASFISQERASGVPIYPSKKDVFNALEQTPFDKVKVVIMGQDPYHGPGQAHGLSFSVPKGIAIPPSLRNIYLELKSDLAIEPPKHGDLSSWAQQGVLLLNATLTVRKNSPKSHYGYGWERFTHSIIEALCQRDTPTIFLLWGRSAQEKCHDIIQKYPKQLPYVLTAAHPSPFSAHSGFFGCQHFSKTNQLLESLGVQGIDWSLPCLENSEVTV